MERPKSLVDLAYENKARIIAANKAKGIETYWITDIESGYPIQVTKEQREEFFLMFEQCKPKLETKEGDKIGCVYYYGTGGSKDQDKWLDEYFKDYKDER